MSRKSNRDRLFIYNLAVNAPKQEARLALPPRRYSPHVPTPKQLAFLLCPRTEVFFGGAAGPGKSEGLLMAALQLVEYPGYHALVLRRTFRQLNQTGSIMNRARQWLAGSDATWSSADKRFTFPSHASITFGNLDSEDDVYQYDSSEFQFIGFDELTSFSEGQYTYLFSRLRATKDNPLPIRMRAASNPGNRGHDWVKARFMIGQPPEALQREFPTRFFLPARIADNPHIRSDCSQNLLPSTSTKLIFSPRGITKPLPDIAGMTRLGAGAQRALSGCGDPEDVAGAWASPLARTRRSFRRRQYIRKRRLLICRTSSP
jgi:hypothetical protein